MIDDQNIFVLDDEDEQIVLIRGGGGGMSEVPAEQHVSSLG